MNRSSHYTKHGIQSNIDESNKTTSIEIKNPILSMKYPRIYQYPGIG